MTMIHHSIWYKIRNQCRLTTSSIYWHSYWINIHRANIHEQRALYATSCLTDIVLRKHRPIFHPIITLHWPIEAAQVIWPPSCVSTLCIDSLLTTYSTYLPNWCAFNLSKQPYNHIWYKMTKLCHSIGYKILTQCLLTTSSISWHLYWINICGKYYQQWALYTTSCLACIVLKHRSLFHLLITLHWPIEATHVIWPPSCAATAMVIVSYGTWPNYVAMVTW